MTSRGQRNHYNVKLLRGYGISINVKDNHLILKNGQNDITGISDKEEWFVSKIPYEKIVISGKGYVSTEAISLLNQNNINIILTDTYGNPVSFMNGAMVSNTAIQYRMGQYDTFRNPEKILQLQKWILKEKIQSQINFFKSTENPELQDGIIKLELYHSQIDSKTNLKDLIKIEAGSGRHYFLNYAKLIPEKYGFQSRRGGGLANSKRYASDIINALLNYGYTVLAGEIAKFVNGKGLDPYYGFYHKPDRSFQALVYDLIEPFRWLVEITVYKMANIQDHSSRIRLKDYTHTRDGIVVMDSDLIRRFLELLERKFQSQRLYGFKHGVKREDGMSMCQEITISKIFIQKLVEGFTYNVDIS
ncbi:MAG: cas [Nitrosarchaeum sp.]|nr:cas [Nitrosarchaeum sp.]